MTFIIIKDKLPIDKTKNESKTISKQNLFLQGRFRWNIIINILVIGVFIIPFLVPLLITFILNAYFLLNWFLFLIIAIFKHFKIYRTLKRHSMSDEEKLKSVKSNYKFIMVTFMYKEPIELIIKSLDNITQIYGSEKCIMTVCLEEKTPDLDIKINKIIHNFELKFKELIITVHLFGVQGEIPGKCSNSNFGIRSLFNHLSDSNANFKVEDYIITSFDIDTFFHKAFLNILKEEINKEKSIDKIIWQPLLYYNWNFDKLSFFTRIIGIFRSTLMAGALTTFNINVMSVYVSSLKLYVDGNFVHPWYQMEDIICYIRWLTISKSSELKIKLIYCATISGPTSGDSMWSELKEMIRQSQRWASDSAEVFHYFITKSKRINIFNSLIWSFSYLNYYAGILCASSLLFISTSIKLFILFLTEKNKTDKFDIKNYFFVFLIFLYTLNMSMIMLNKLAVNSFLKELNVKENLGLFRQLFHLLMSFPTQIFNSFVVLYGFFSIIVFGKKICKHGASKKDDLKF